MLVASIDEGHQLLGPAIARVGREIAGDGFVRSPPAQLNMAMAVPAQICQHLFRQLGIARYPLGRCVGLGIEADPVHADGQFPALAVHRPRHPRAIAPGIGALQVVDEGGSLGINLAVEGQRIGLEEHRALSAANLVLVQLAEIKTGHEQLPDAAALALHRVAAAIPLIEGADHTDPAGARRPQAEVDAHHAFLDVQVRAQAAEQLGQAALAQGLAIGGQKGGLVNGVGIGQGAGAAAGLLDEQAIIQLGNTRQAGNEQPVGVQALHGAARTAISGQHPDPFSLGQKGTDQQRPLPFIVVRPQHRMWCVMTQLDDFANLFFQHVPTFPGCAVVRLT